MKPSLPILLAFVAGLILACTGTRKEQTLDGPWKLQFNSYTQLYSVSAFKQVLIHAHRWQKNVSIRKKKDEPPDTLLNVGGPTEPPAPNVNNFPKDSEVNKDSLHVTQRIVFFEEKDYDDALEQIRYKKDLK